MKKIRIGLNRLKRSKGKLIVCFVSLLTVFSTMVIPSYALYSDFEPESVPYTVGGETYDYYAIFKANANYTYATCFYSTEPITMTDMGSYYSFDNMIGNTYAVNFDSSGTILNEELVTWDSYHFYDNGGVFYASNYDVIADGSVFFSGLTLLDRSIPQIMSAFLTVLGVCLPAGLTILAVYLGISYLMRSARWFNL